MRPERLQRALAAAIEDKLLPAASVLPACESPRPWPVVLLTALGAWLAAIPLLGVVALLLGDLVTRSAGPYLVGGLLLSGALVVLRSSAVALFVEQLAVPALLVGGGALGFGLFRDLPPQAGAAVLAVVALAVGALVRGSWLRVLFGAVAAVLLAAALVPARFNEATLLTRGWWSCHAVLAVWLLAMTGQRLAAGARAAAVLEPLAAGWLLAAIAGLAWWSGMTLLVGASAGGGIAGEVARELARREAGGALRVLPQAISAGVALAAAAWGAWRWAALRRPWLAGVALVGVMLAWFMPALGAACLALAVCATTHRWRLAASAAVAAAWIIGAFYYQLHWPLQNKAVVLVAAGAALGAFAWLGLGSASRGDDAGSPLAAGPHSGPAPKAAPARLPWLGITATVVLVLAVANVGILQKEALIRDGRPVFVELVPIDPRSLMQGDFMRLNFNVPAVPEQTGGLLRTGRPHAVARLDGRGVATLTRLDDPRTPLAAGELRIELTPKGGRWILVSDAWFFAEGQGTRYERAKYGEFRVEPGGRALLVGLRGTNLEPL
jgi:uncharacterized membrane-anchored protein